MTPLGPALLRRVSWGAIFAGTVVAIAAQILLSLLGIALGLASINPVTESQPFSGLATGTGIWWVVTSLVSLFLGGWVAGRLSGVPRRTDSVLHGVVTWGLASILGVWMVGSTVGTIVGGAFGALGQGVSAIGDAVSGGGGGAGGTGSEGSEQARQETDGVWDEILQEARQVLRQTGQDDLRPESVSRRLERAERLIAETVEDVARNPQQAEAEISQTLERLLASAEEVASEADREAAVNVLVRRTDMSREEAQRTVDGWLQTWQQAQTRAERIQAQAAQRAKEYGESVASGLATAATWTFVTVLLGMIAAALGGAVGKRRSVEAVYARETVR